MSRLATSFLLGYHGCDKAVGMAALLQHTQLKPSENGLDWLGKGIYFWESDPQRAWEWAQWKHKTKKYAEPFVIGAVIDLGNCLDLVVRENIELLADAYDGLKEEFAVAGKPLPENLNADKDPFDDLLLRFLDYAVVEKVHASLEEAGAEAFDTVRGLFQEGGQAYENSGFMQKTHTQIAVRNPKAIKGIFLP